MALLCGDSFWRQAQGSRSPHYFRSALVGSLLFHCSLAGLVSAVALQKPALIEPVVIDLTAAELPEATIPQQSAASAAGNSRHRLVPARPAPVAPPQVPAPAPAKTAASAAPVAAVTQPATRQAAEAASTATSISGGQTGAQGPGQAGSAAGLAGSAGQAAADTETLQKHYLREHFAYIRDLIGKQLQYPRRAIRMGWSGRVTVSFVVLVDGSVAELRVSRSSGVPLLDHNALETVERAAPFPKPPVSARLVLPVDYILE